MLGEKASNLKSNMADKGFDFGSTHGEKVSNFNAKLGEGDIYERESERDTDIDRDIQR
jgi:hypothetical protein